MGWNEPEKGPEKKDSWSGKNQPPDLEEALKRLQKAVKKFFLPKSSFNKTNKPSLPSSSILITGIVTFIGIIWLLAGIFIVDPAEQAVILRLGKYLETVGPGPHWIPPFIASKRIYNVDRISDYSYSSQMLTKDQNLVSVSIAVQYRIDDLKAYLFNVANPEESLRQATSSALRQVVGTTTLDQIITEGREAWGVNVQDSLIKILKQYQTGITIVSVSPQPARAPEDVQEAFDDAIKAQEDEKRFKEQAYAYKAQVVPIAEGKSKRIIQEAQATKQQMVLKAQGETAEFLALSLPYRLSPKTVARRMYIETIESVLTKTNKVIIDSKINNLLYLPLESLINPNKKLISPSLPELPNDTNSVENSENKGRTIIRKSYAPLRKDNEN